MTLISKPSPRILWTGILLLPLLQACSGSDDAATQRDNAQPVITTTTQWEPELKRVEAVGTSRALRSVTLYPAVAGEVLAIHFNTDQRVKAGQTLVELDARDAKLAVSMAKVQLADAQRLLDRYQRAGDSGAVTVSTLDDARSAADRARIALDRAEVTLDHHSIEAPFNGHIGLTTLDPGARIEPATAIATMDDRSVLLVTFELPEILLGQLQVGQQIALTTWADDRREAMGRVVDIDSRADPQTRTFIVRAHVDNADDTLRPGMSFRIELTLAGGRYPIVPESALQWGGDGAYVWAVESGLARRVAATIVQRREGKILLDAALPEGTRVVVEGVQRMREGQAVRDAGSEAAKDTVPVVPVVDGSSS
jgi:RND family efflux transporter MFP subunit